MYNIRDKASHQKLAFWIYLFVIAAFFSCQDDPEVLIIEDEITIDVTPDEEDCYYVYQEVNEFIYGAWSPIKVIDYVYDDTTYYDVEEGRGGFNFDTNSYSDSYELKDNGTFNLFYARDGRMCKDVEWGKFEYANDTLTFTEFRNDTINVAVLHLVEDTLIVEEVINRHPSRITMLRIN